MTFVAQREILRLRRLHQGAERELDVFVERRHLSAREQLAMMQLKKRKLLLKDRIARLESMLRARPPLAAE